MKRLKKRLAFLLMVTLIVGNVISVLAETTIQRTDVQSGTKVTGDYKTNFKFTVKQTDDDFSVYQIAKMKWNDVSNSYDEPVWVDEIKEWLTNSTKYNTAAYTTPVELGKASESVVIDFLNAVRSDDTLTASLAAYKVSADNISQPQVEANGVGYTVSSVSFGFYMVDAKNTALGRAYQPVLINVIPSQEGPTGNWYLDEAIEATLKYETISITKKVNGEDYDIVRMGETVNFDINTTVPDYPDGSSKRFNINDDMSEGYTYTERTAVLYYKTEANNEWTELPAANYTTVLAAEAFQYGITGGDVFAYSVYNGTNYTYYGLVKGQLVSLGSYSDVESSWETIRSAYNTKTGLTISGTIEKRPLKKSLLNFAFNYDSLKALGATAVRLTYDATINDNVIVGDNTNTNKVTLYYQEDSAGTDGSSTDTVTTWTYGVNITKLDGTKDVKTYLAGAIFSLYRISDIYCSEDTGAGTSSADYSKYKWYSNQDGAQTYTEAGMSETLDGVAALGGTYFYVPIDVEENQCNNNTAKHKHIAVYKLMKSDITSVATEEGVLVKGLDPAKYLLLETKAPEGFNPLSEGILFTIDKLGAEQFQAANNSYKGFVDDDGNVVDNGVYDIEVLNYTGINLPATGGIGTTIFIVAGILLMIAAGVILVRHNRKKQLINL